MPLVPTARPDGPEIRRLIRERGYTVKRFGQKIGRNPGSIVNLTCQDRRVSVVFIRQIATALAVRPSQISDMADDDPQDTAAKRVA